MKNQILTLRSEGKTYNEIVAIIGCSKSTVSYYCGKGQIGKAKLRSTKNRRGPRATLARKVDMFLSRNKAKEFKYKVRGKEHEAILNKLIKTPKCYLTGDTLDLGAQKTYQLDHIIPFSRGGKNTIDNVGLTSTTANKMKSDLTLSELREVCIKIYNKQKWHKSEWQNTQA